MRIFYDDQPVAAQPEFSPCMLVVQARLGSTRLPGKVLRPLLGKPLVHYLIERLRRVQSVQGIVIATTTNAEDDQLVDFCNKEGLHVVRGAVDDVLSRYILASDAFGLDVVVRITADCPLIDPDLIEKGLALFRQHSNTLDYLSICHNRTYPLGMDFEIIQVKSLRKAYLLAKDPAEKEHVTPYIWRHPEQFQLANMQQKEHQAEYRLTVDTLEDFMLVERIYKTLYPQNPEFGRKEIVALLKKHPDWLLLNAHIQQKSV